ncbi:MAG: LptF/LptG family permease [Sedimentisphaerales bacterium]|nr:LptF/LptG family permease [Sedimentisphaerales bacterium]
MVLILHRYIFRELLKVFLLASVGLTLILSLGSILAPVQEYGVGPRQVLSLMGYFLPITLTFVLPMAALFASALVYGRFASDNELDACRASGVSIMALVYPGLTLAIVVAIANLILSFHMLPYFVHLAEKSLQGDAKQILFRNIQRRGYYELPTDDPWLIYADEVNLKNDTLVGVVVASLERNRIGSIYTAERAAVKFNAHDTINEVQIIANNTFQIGTEDDGGFSVEQGAINTEFGSLLADDIKFKKINEMKKIRADLMLFHPIEKLANDTYAQFTTELLAQEIRAKTGTDANSYYRLYSGEKLVELRADSVLADEEKVKLEGRIVVVESYPGAGTAPVTLRPTKASLHIEGNKLAPTLTMDLYNALNEDSGDLQMRHVIRGLFPKDNAGDIDIGKKFGTQNVLDSLRLASDSAILKQGPSPKLGKLTAELEDEIQKTLLQIRAEIHTRLVFGIGCVPMILIGIGIAICKKGGHLLTAFGASCIPAAVLIICIISGRQITQNTDVTIVSGVGLIWSGLVFLLLLVGVIYRRLLKN